MSGAPPVPAVRGVTRDDPFAVPSAVPVGRPDRLRAGWRCLRLSGWAARCDLAFECAFARAEGASEERAVQLRWTHRFLAGAIDRMGLRVRCHGTIPPGGAILAPNHLGYCDVPAIGSCLECSFTTTDEVIENPVFGRLVQGSAPIVVPRRLTSRLLEARDQVRDRLGEGTPVCIFFEGTSTGGDRVLPFRPFFLEAAIETGAPVVPVALHWRATAPGTRVDEDLAFWKDHRLIPHLWRLLGLSGFEVEVWFGEPIETRGAKRKTLAPQVRERVLALLGESGWPAPPPV